MKYLKMDDFEILGAIRHLRKREDVCRSNFRHELKEYLDRAFDEYYELPHDLMEHVPFCDTCGAILPPSVAGRFCSHVCASEGEVE